MRKASWSRKNFLLVAGLSLIGVHLGSMLVNFVAKSLLNPIQKLKKIAMNEIGFWCHYVLVAQLALSLVLRDRW